LAAEHCRLEQRQRLNQFRRVECELKSDRAAVRADAFVREREAIDGLTLAPPSAAHARKLGLPAKQRTFAASSLRAYGLAGEADGPSGSR
jgi:hypothetical protein